MSEWWTYSLSDFLLFSPRTYYRLFELYNLAIWPAQLLALALGALILALLRPGPVWKGRVVATVLAACWLWVAWAYFLERYETINWAASYFAFGFAVEALLVLWIGVAYGLSFGPLSHLTGRAGLAIFLFALGAQPLIGPLLGRPWTQAEVFGIAPDVHCDAGHPAHRRRTCPLGAAGHSCDLVRDQLAHAVDHGLARCPDAGSLRVPCGSSRNVEAGPGNLWGVAR